MSKEKKKNPNQAEVNSDAEPMKLYVGSQPVGGRIAVQVEYYEKVDNGRALLVHRSPDQ